MKTKIFFLLLASLGFAGQYDGSYTTKRGTLKISDSNGAVNFILLSSGGNSISAACDISGTATMESKTAAIYQTRSDTGGCAVLLDFQNIGTVVVKSRGCQMFCTDRSSFDGEYKK